MRLNEDTQRYDVSQQGTIKVYKDIAPDELSSIKKRILAVLADNAFGIHVGIEHYVRDDQLDEYERFIRQHGHVYKKIEFPGGYDVMAYLKATGSHVPLSAGDIQMNKAYAESVGLSDEWIGGEKDDHMQFEYRGNLLWGKEFSDSLWYINHAAKQNIDAVVWKAFIIIAQPEFDFLKQKESKYFSVRKLKDLPKRRLQVEVRGYAASRVK